MGFCDRFTLLILCKKKRQHLPVLALIYRLLKTINLFFTCHPFPSPVVVVAVAAPVVAAVPVLVAAPVVATVESPAVAVATAGILAAVVATLAVVVANLVVAALVALRHLYRGNLALD